MRASDALAWICAREADFVASAELQLGVEKFSTHETRRRSQMPSYELRVNAVRIATARERVNGAWEACFMLCDDYDRRALRDVRERWMEFAWAAEHPEDPILAPAPSDAP